MTSVMPARTAVLLPGTGSDEIFVRAVFTRPLAAVGVAVTAPAPPPGEAVVTGYTALLDRIAERTDGPLLVGGVSLGAHLATAWAVRNADRCAGVLAALPAWNGPGETAPAAIAATASADLIERHGLDAALSLATRDVAPWLAEELTRAWRRHGQGLAASLRTAARHPAPELPALRTLDVPVGIATCVDDPVHPVAVARAWAGALPCSALVETTLDALGADRESLGRAATLAWLRATTRRPRRSRPVRSC
ncbi:alpha/beta fold hydrolase [Saccharomonospora cyanea]|uniref:Thioesterase of type I polyketide synthase or non-ribosomal peptide synthase like protein n=1 Tax=Saccharomonospora cyanea NA-134 TaxID=882082 RepID=H5XMW9_9PSEU|nr:thioesterase of type I polyketide synthase or non-ribosomal peptide synthase like protein [Saccharomonospora cyanea NA-134]